MSLKTLIEVIVEQELEEVNSIGAGGVSATGGSPLGQDMSPAHKKMWSGDKKLKKESVSESSDFERTTISLKALVVHRESLFEAYIDCFYKKACSRTSGPLEVMEIDAEPGFYQLVDGYHRLVEFLFRQQHKKTKGFVEVQINRDPGIQSYYAVANANQRWAFNEKLKFGNLEDLTSRATLEDHVRSGKLQENLADKMGLKRATDQVRRDVVGGSPVYMDRHDSDEAGTKKVMKKVAKNLNRKPYSKKPPMMGLTETRFAITPEQAKNWDLMKSLDIWQGNPGFGIYLRFRGKNTLQLDISASNGSRTYGAIYPNKKQIVLIVEEHSWRLSPIFAEIVATLNQQIPDLSDFALFAYDEENQPTPLNLTLGQAAQQVRQIDVRSPDYNPKDEDISYKEFKVHILDDLQDIVWYHATRAKNVESIMAKGLLPSGEFDQGGGWTQFNLNLQNAVYLTADPNYADAIAETLAARFNEPAVVLQVNGEALVDKSKITLDEDSLRGRYDDMIDYTNYEHELPAYYTSVLNKIQSIGYSGVIPPSFISVNQTIQPEPPENNDDWNSSQDDDGVVSSRYA